MKWFVHAAHEPAPLTGLVTPGAPHVRRAGDLRTYYRRFQLALLPCLVFGLYNVGYQANLALSALGREQAAGWRGSLLERLGVGIDPASLWACAAHGALYLLPLWFVSFVAGYAWELGFARVRERELSPGLGLFALIYTLYLPPSLPLWQAALGISFGVVIGKEVFGGTGRQFVHPALAGLAFLAVSYPEALHGAGAWVAVDGHTARTTLSLAATGGIDAVRADGLEWVETLVGRRPGPLGATSSVACLLGAAYLLFTRAINWRIPLAALVGFLSGALFSSWTLGELLPAADVPWYWQLTIGSFAFAALFIATDPVTAAMTQAGRWVYGLLIGVLVIVIRVANPLLPEGAILAILLGNVFAPLIDHAVVRLHILRRRHRPANTGVAR